MQLRSGTTIISKVNAKAMAKVNAIKDIATAMAKEQLRQDIQAQQKLGQYLSSTIIKLLRDIDDLPKHNGSKAVIIDKLRLINEIYYILNELIYDILDARKVRPSFINFISVVIEKSNYLLSDIPTLSAKFTMAEKELNFCKNVIKSVKEVQQKLIAGL